MTIAIFDQAMKKIGGRGIRFEIKKGKIESVLLAVSNIQQPEKHCTMGNYKESFNHFI